MGHKIKSFLVILLLLGLIAALGLFINSGGITSATVAKSIACYQDKDCSDGIKETQDTCRNPGTEYSLCINKPIK